MKLSSPFRAAMRIALALSVFLIGGPAARAVIVASWDLTGASGDQASQPANPGPAGFLGLPMIRGAGLVADPQVNTFSSTGWSGSDAGDYIEFGFTVAPGYAVDLTNLILRTRSANTGPGMMGVYTSLDGFASPYFTIDQSSLQDVLDSDGDLDVTEFLPVSVDSTIDFSSLSDIGPGNFVIRLIEVGNTQADGTGNTGGNAQFRVFEVNPSGPGGTLDVQFNGTITAVPEASASLLAAAAALVAGAAVVIRARRPLSLARVVCRSTH